MSPPLIYLDANVFVAGFETSAQAADPVQLLFRTLAKRNGSAVSSELTLAELLAPIRRPQCLSGLERRSLYFNLFQRKAFVDLVPVGREILIKTAELRSVINYKLPDAIHVVTAIEAGCGYFASNDERLRQLPPGIEKVRTDAAGVNELLGALSR